MLISRFPHTFPLRPNSKLPACKWLESKGNHLSSPNYGIRTGLHVGGLQLVVVDVDNKDVPAEESIQTLKSKGFPFDYTVSTPSGGLHIYVWVRHSETIKNATSWIPGVDIRAHHGYVVGPGSIIDGVEYKSTGTQTAVPSLPAHLILSLPGAGLSDDVCQSVGVPVSEQIKDGIPHGSRDDLTYKLACSYHAKGLDLDSALKYMGDSYSKMDQPPGDHYPLEAALEKVRRVYAQFGAPARPSASTPEASQERRLPSARPSASEDTWAISMETPDLTVDDMLQRYVYVVHGKRVYDITKPPTQRLMKLDEMKEFFRNRRIEKRTLYERWISHSQRPCVDDVMYHPAKEAIYQYEGSTHINTYCPPILPDVEPDPDKRKRSMRYMVEHLAYLTGSVDYGRLVWQWCCHIVQTGTKPLWAVLIVSTQGTGKSMMASVLSKILGESNVVVVTSDHISQGKFSDAILSDKQLCVMAETRALGQGGMSERLKTLVTDDTVVVERKYQDAVTMPAFAAWLCFSNHARPIFLPADDRRWFVVAPPIQPKPAEYYDELAEWMRDDEMMAHLRQAMMEESLLSFRATERPPMTEAKATLIREGQGYISMLIQDAVEDRTGPFGADIVTDALVVEYVENTLGRKLDKKEAANARAVLGEISKNYPLTTSQIRAKVRGSHTKVRLKAVRPGWQDAGTQALRAEFERAQQFAMGRKPTARAEQ